MPSYLRESPDAVCWNCDRQAPETTAVSLPTRSGKHVVVTLCHTCHMESYQPLVEAPGLRAVEVAEPTVLVVDDEPDIARMLRHTFEAKGYTVEAAANGVEALHAACRRMPDIVVLDLRMPVMDGHAFIAAWREVTAAAPVPIVAISEHERPISTEELRVEAFLPKPFDLGALVATVDRLLTAVA